jgi:hypothetical protein
LACAGPLCVSQKVVIIKKDTRNIVFSFSKVLLWTSAELANLNLGCGWKTEVKRINRKGYFQLSHHRMAGRIAASGVGLVACMGAYSMLMAEPARAQALTQEQKKTMRIRSHLSGAPRSCPLPREDDRS